MPAIHTSPFARVFTAALVVAGLGLGLRTVSAQSLADVAKKEEERRKTVAAPSKVYTNKDLSPAPPGSPHPDAATAKPDDDKDKTAVADKDKAGTTAEPAKDKEAAKDKVYWSGRLHAIQDKLDRDTNFADAMQTRINALNTDFVNRDDPAQRAVIARERQKSTAELNRLKQDIITDKKAIGDLEEEARRAGVPPGWLR